MDEGHDADDDPDEAGEQRQDHEGTRDVQVGCGGGCQRSTQAGSAQALTQGHGR